MDQENLFDMIDNAKPAKDTADRKASAKTPTPQNPPSDEEPSAPPPNAPDEYSVSEISQKLKKTVEGAFNYVRVRGELSRVTIARSGHMYSSLKDDKAVLDAVCWRGTVSRLGVAPEEGLDVVVTGRLTTYPGRSNYQIIIESMELAGEGALLKMLEERRKKLAGEGLFDAERKRAIPYLPQTIGVITSPTGAVIRDIMHRLNDRFPRTVYLWPAMVQGDRAAAQVTQGIYGFNALPVDSPYRPDVLIVARGGGSLEDLMPFNDEALVRAIAASDIPIICAVGHETDTSLADYAADLRAPTPTGAAEKAVPVRSELVTRIKQGDARLYQGIRRRLQEYRNHIIGLARGLPQPQRILESTIQRLDHLGGRLDQGLITSLHRRQQKLLKTSARLSLSSQRQARARQNDKINTLYTRILRSIQQNIHTRRTRIESLAARVSLRPRRQHINHSRTTLSTLSVRLDRAAIMRCDQARARYSGQAALLETLSFKNTLARGFTVIRDATGAVVTDAGQLQMNDQITVTFKDDQQRTAKITD